jgi:hypothetical protein
MDSYKIAQVQETTDGGKTRTKHRRKQKHQHRLLQLKIKSEHKNVVLSVLIH